MKYLIIKLKHILYSILIIGLLSGCDENEGAFGWHNRVNENGIEKNYKVVVIDSCEYIMYDAVSGYSGNGFLAHKGNCKFCQLRNKQKQ